MNVFGHPVLVDYVVAREDTASEKTPMQWHNDGTLIPEVVLASMNQRDMKAMTRPISIGGTVASPGVGNA